MSTPTSNPALLIMDVQNGIVSRIGNEEVLKPFQKAIAAARENHIPVFFIRVALREGYPEVSSRNKMFSHIASYGGMTVNDFATQIHEAVKPEPGEQVIVKKRVSAFAGSDLEILLRSHNIDTLILSGISASGVVLSTVREAADKDYAIRVLSDACFDADPEVHRVLTEKVFPRQADVVTVDAWVDSLKA